MTPKSHKSLYIKRALFALLILVSALLQHSGLMPEIFGARAFLLIPALVAVSMQEKSMAGLFFGAFSGVLWDCATSGGDGFYSFCLTLVGYFVCVLMTYFLRSNIYTAFILSFVSSVIVSFAAWLVFICFKGYEGAFSAFTGFYLPSAIYTAMFILLYYAIVQLIVIITKEKN